MNTYVKTLSIDIADDYPSTLRILGHELNTDSFYLKLKLLNNKQPFELTSTDSATVTLVTNGNLVVSDRECEITAPNIIVVNLSNEKNKEPILQPGRMIIEVKLTSQNGNVFILPVKFCAIIDFSEEARAQITPESYGTTAEILREVALARGNYETLGLRLDNLAAEIAKKLKLTPIYGTQNETVFENNTLVDVLYKAYVNNTVYYFWTIAQADPAPSASPQYRLSKNGIEYRTLSSGTWSLVGEIPSNYITFQDIRSTTFTTQAAFKAYNFEMDKLYSVTFTTDVLFKGSQAQSALVICPSLSQRMVFTYNDGIYTSSYIPPNWTDLAQKSAPVVTQESGANAFDNCTDVGKIYRVTEGAFDYQVGVLSDTAQWRLNEYLGLEIRQKENDTWQMWQTLANADTYADIIAFLAEWSSHDFRTIENIGEISSTTEFNQSKYCTETVEFLFIAANTFAAALGLPENSQCRLTYNNGYQLIEPVRAAVKFARKVNSIAPNFSAEDWLKIQKTLNIGEVGWDNLSFEVKNKIDNKLELEDSGDLINSRGSFETLAQRLTTIENRLSALENA